MSTKTAPLGDATPAQVSATRLTIIALTYFIAGRLGLELATVGSNITLIWLPTGIAVATLFRWGWRYWPAVWLGALAVNLLIGSTLWVALGISVGNTLAPMLSVAILKRWHFNPDISSWRDVPVFIMGGALLGMLVSATGGVAALAAGGVLPESAVGWAWLSWWLGDSVGVLVGGMAIITFNHAEFVRLIRSERWNELFFSAMAVAAVGMAWIVIPAYPLSHIFLSSLVMIVLIWIALRMGPWPAAIALLTLSACAALALSMDRGPFLDQNPNLAIAKLWADIATFSILTLLVSALTAERKSAEEKLRLAASVFTHAHEGIMITTLEGRIIDVNRGFTRINGYDRDEVLGRNPSLLSSGHHDKEFYAAMWRDLVENGYWSGEIWNRRKNGEIYIEHQTISAVRDALGKALWYVALFSDVTSTKEHERQLEHLAHYDALTTLPNRVLLADRLHHGLAQAQRRNQRLAVAYLDLDGFKNVNDRHGHEAGDQLLIILAARMKQALREGDTLARLGGDEFVAVLVDLEEVADSLPLLTRLLAAAAEPAQIGDLSLQVSASLGVTFYPQEDDVDADQLLRQADQAMYQAKLAGKNCYHVFDADRDRSTRGHHESLEDIRRALAQNEFTLYYQPKVNMRSGTIVGTEALIRWQHPEKGLLPPAVFLPVIEDHPLAVDIGEWVIATALSQIESWHAIGLDIPVSVNVGARQLQQSNFVARLSEMLSAHPTVRPGNLELEVLETSALEDITQVSHVISACHEIGVNFSLDDFGTGYSSLTYLKRLPVTQLKIDQSFVRDMLDDPDDLAILEGVIGLAAAFRREVIAEGVETLAHGEMLLQLGCELAQGYGIARPMPAHKIPDWAASWRPDPSWIGLNAVSRDDFPLLFASVEHRAWINAMESYLKNERTVPPPQNHHQCHFGRWLDADGLARYHSQPTLDTIVSMHKQVHILAVELCRLQVQNRNVEALAGLGELHGLCNALLKQLKALLQENSR